MERGRLVGAKRGLKLQQVWAIRFWLSNKGRLRDRAMFDLAIDSKLRGCDIVKIKIGDLVSGGRVRSRAIVIQQVTGIGLPRQDYGTHSLRRTKASIIYKQTGNLRAVQICSATPHLKVPFDIWVPMSKMSSHSQKAQRSRGYRLLAPVVGSRPSYLRPSRSKT